MENIAPKTMMVEVNGEIQQRRIVDFVTNRDLLMEVMGLDALKLPVWFIEGIPETFEGERLVRYMDGSKEIIGP